MTEKISYDTCECVYLNGISAIDFKQSKIKQSEADVQNELSKLYVGFNNMSLEDRYILTTVHSICSKTTKESCSFSRIFSWFTLKFIPETNTISRTVCVTLHPRDKSQSRKFISLDKGVKADANNFLERYFEETDFVSWMKDYSFMKEYAKQMLVATYSTINCVSPSDFFELCKFAQKEGINPNSDMQVYARIDKLCTMAEHFRNMRLKKQGGQRKFIKTVINGNKYSIFYNE